MRRIFTRPIRPSGNVGPLRCVAHLVTIAIATLAICLLGTGAVAALERRPEVATVRVKTQKRRQASSDS